MGFHGGIGFVDVSNLPHNKCGRALSWKAYQPLFSELGNRTSCSVKFEQEAERCDDEDHSKGDPYRYLILEYHVGLLFAVRTVSDLANFHYWYSRLFIRRHIESGRKPWASRVGLP